MLAFVLAIATVWVIPQAIAFPLVAATPSQIAAENDAATSTDIERRVKATGREIEGRIQRGLGEATNSPANQVEGSAKQFSGEAQNRAEDLGDRVKDAARGAEDSTGNLVDRVKDLFD
ncbi:MAG: CsbD family protein [Leptolyngbyaceae cyanobacterium RM2_2_4]|nr:CsbD family protein [Leptolyngbyaceae cyanobacterium SM1_4_3]NJN91273.1 CsbD family protein [Leptolyngbyaceae cyanobacterium SL_5_14]NJO51428.1 CsbD family protein [Leptolyngbyaceae cyanobacterium RM2_2_4]NJO66626.1 CsbD family protein [Leptolyngbyaceae cyanobacterium RM1_405_57]